MAAAAHSEIGLGGQSLAGGSQCSALAHALQVLGMIGCSNLFMLVGPDIH